MITDELLDGARAAAGDASAALALAALIEVPESPAAALALLFALGETDLTVARVVEPHLDARMILREAGMDAPEGTFGVFAAEATDRGVSATARGGRWTLSGVKPWCSLAGQLDRALVTATTPDGRRLFMVDLREDGVRVGGEPWIAHGLATVITSDVSFDDVDGVPVGAPQWYLSRPGFAWGGIRVAAVWAGATQALTTTLLTNLIARGSDPIRAANLGRADVATWTAQLALEHAAERMSECASADEATLLAARTRAVVADAAETVLREVGHALGPAPLAYDAVHARRAADLALYIRQHHAERDLAALAGLRLCLPLP